MKEGNQNVTGLTNPAPGHGAWNRHIIRHSLYDEAHLILHPCYAETSCKGGFPE